MHVCKPDKRSVYGMLQPSTPTHQPYCIEDVMTIAPELYGDLSECETMLEAELVEVNELAGNIGQ